MMGMDAEVENLRAAVSRHFTVSQITVNPFAVTFRVTSDPTAFDGAFDALRKDLVPKNFIPSIVQEPSGYVIHVQRRPETKFRGNQVNVLLLLVTVGTAWVAGAVNWQVYANLPGPNMEAFGYGLVSFPVPLLAMLGAHEMGNYVMARRHGVRASLPFFIPSVPPLGTFGAFISMRDPIPNRRALLEIGISGPLIGFAVAVPVTLLGLFLAAGDTRPPVLNGGGTVISSSLLYGWMQMLFPQALVDPFRRHPTAFAGWVGLFVTAINLLPAGQLDGGHVARALLGERHRYLSWGAVLFLLSLGAVLILIGSQGFSWFLFALIILLLGVKHPPPLNDITRLRPSRKALGVLAIVILAITFIPAPFIEIPTNASFAFETSTAPHTPLDSLNRTIAAAAQAIIAVNVNNTGNVDEKVRLEIRPQNLDRINWTLSFVNYTVLGGGPEMTVVVNGTTTVITLNVTHYATVSILVGVPANSIGGPFTFGLRGEIPDARRSTPIFEEQIDVNITVP